MGMVGKTLKALGTGLDMSHASRMQRAQDLGFDTSKTYYHGTGADFDSFREGYGGVYFSDSPEYANRYTTSVDPMAARSDVQSGRNIIPANLGVQNTFDTRNPAHRKIYEEQFLNKWGNGTPIRDDGLPDWVEADDFQEFFDAEGLPFDSAVVGEPPTKMPDGSFKPESSLLVTDESKIRSVNAAFDPAKKDSANLLAGTLGGAILGGSMLPQDAAAWEETLANPYSQRIEATNQRPAFIEAARNIREYSESPLGGSWLEGVADLAEKVGWDEARGIMDYINASLDVAP